MKAIRFLIFGLLFQSFLYPLVIQNNVLAVSQKSSAAEEKVNSDAEDLDGVIQNVAKQLKDIVSQESNIDVSFDNRNFVKNKAKSMAEYSSPLFENFVDVYSVKKDVKRVIDPEVTADYMAEQILINFRPEGELTPQQYEKVRQYLANGLLNKQLVQRGDLLIPLYWERAGSLKKVDVEVANNGNIKFDPLLYFTPIVSSLPSRFVRSQSNFNSHSVKRFDKIIVKNLLGLSLVEFELNLSIKGDSQTCEISDPEPHYTASILTNFFYTAKYTVVENKFCSNKRGCANGSCAKEKGKDHQQCSKINVVLDYNLSIPQIKLEGGKVSIENPTPIQILSRQVNKQYDLCAMDF